MIIKHLFTIVLVTLITNYSTGQSAQRSDDDKVLVFTKTEGYRHASIETGVEALKTLALKNNYKIVHTEDATFFESSDFTDFKAIIFLSTTGDIFNKSQQAIFENYIQNGGGFVGIHAAADTEYDWPWYGKMVGGYFESHPNDPNVLQATIHKTTHPHPSTDHLDDNWIRSDEWYNYKNLNFTVTALLTLDESTYEGGTNGDYHPIAWYHNYDGGRAFYTGGGHTEASFAEPDFVDHLSKGILWAMGR